MGFASAAPLCDGHACVGPVIVMYPSANCKGTPVSYRQVIQNRTVAGAPNFCFTDETAQTSETWQCAPGGASSMGFVQYSYSVPRCGPSSASGSKIPFVRSTKTTGQCFNGVPPTPSTHPAGISYAIFCSAEQIASTPIEAPQTTGSPLGAGIALGQPWTPCPNGQCLSAHVSYYMNAQCSGSPLKSYSLYQNMGTIPLPNDSCYTIPVTETELGIPVQLNANFFCTNAEMHLQFYPNGCNPNLQPVYARHYPKYDACMYSQAQNLYFKFFCSAVF